MASLVRPQVLAYDNSSHFLGSHFPHLTVGQSSSEIELGDQITLDAPGQTLFKISVIFESWGPTSGTVDIYMRFYANDGPGGAPGSVIYDGGWFGDMLHHPGLNSIDFEVPLIVAPQTFTWTVRLANRTGSTGEFGAAYFNPPTVGSSDDFIWISEGGSPWIPYSWGGMPVANLGAQVHALVPEPLSGIALLGGLALMARRRARGR
jgi:hypothetical protein